MYANLATQASRNVGHAKTLYAELRKRFHRNSGGSEAGEETAAA
jgi:hypothetical protein